MVILFTYGSRLSVLPAQVGLCADPRHSLRIGSHEKAWKTILACNSNTYHCREALLTLP